jgi:hypothetical protein
VFQPGLGRLDPPALAYLTAEVRRRSNLAIVGDVKVDRVLFDGTTATGVVTDDGTVYWADEVISPEDASGARRSCFVPGSVPPPTSRPSASAWSPIYRCGTAPPRPSRLL